MPQTDQEDEAKLISLLPSLNGGEIAIASALPETFCLDVPFIPQLKQHYCAAACVQMIQSYYKRIVIDQDGIAEMAGWVKWDRLNHESFSEDLDRLYARLNFLPATYYPGAFILPAFERGYEGGDLILRNREKVSEIDFEFFKVTLKTTMSPVLYRIHFTTEDYPMDDKLAQRLDNAGHCLLMIGWNERGFLFHDPWDKFTWGGRRGGPTTEISYDTLVNLRPFVNCCKEGSHSGTALRARLTDSRQALVENRDVQVVLKVEWPGVESITAKSYSLTDLSARLWLPEHFQSHSSEIQTRPDLLRPGQSHEFVWDVNVGPKVGSFQINAEVVGSLELPSFKWEAIRKRQLISISAASDVRYDVKSEKWFDAYGRV